MTLSFDNNAFMVDKILRDIKTCVADSLHYRARLGTEPQLVQFLLNTGNAQATIRYARLGKISKELADQRLDRYLSINSEEIKNLFKTVENLEP